LRFVRAASQGGIEIGFDADIAQLIAAQTVVGAASLQTSQEDLFSPGPIPTIKYLSFLLPSQLEFTYYGYRMASKALKCEW